MHQHQHQTWDTLTDTWKKNPVGLLSKATLRNHPNLTHLMNRSAWTTDPPKLPIWYYSVLSPKADSHFNIPRRAKGWVDLGGCLLTEMVYMHRQPPTDTSTNRARHRVTLIRHNKLLISHLKRRHSSSWSLLWSASRPLLRLLSMNQHHLQTSNTSNTR